MIAFNKHDCDVMVHQINVGLSQTNNKHRVCIVNLSPGTYAVYLLCRSGNDTIIYKNQEQLCSGTKQAVGTFLYGMQSTLEKLQEK